MTIDPDEHPADALDRIEIDDEATDEATRWAADELIDGRSTEEVAADLTGQGWSPDQADEIAEYARKATRRARGVVTRDDVVRMVEAKHRRATTGMTSFFRSGLGLFAVFGYFTQLRETVRLSRELKLLAQKRLSMKGSSSTRDPDPGP